VDWNNFDQLLFEAQTPPGFIALAKNYRAAERSRRQKAVNNSALNKDKAKRFVCPGCNATFPTGKDWERHWKSRHHGQQVDGLEVPIGWYGCVCGYKHCRKDLLCRHLGNKKHAFKERKLQHYVCRCGQHFPEVCFDDFRFHISTCGLKSPGRPKSANNSSANTTADEAGC
jgi:uncharacterized C2H2 Zn-finger protein